MAYRDFVKSHITGDGLKFINKKVRHFVWLGTLSPEAGNEYILPFEEFISQKYLK